MNERTDIGCLHPAALCLTMPALVFFACLGAIVQTALLWISSMTMASWSGSISGVMP